MNLINLMKLIGSYSKLVKNFTKTENVFSIESALFNSASQKDLENSIQSIMNISEYRKAYEENYQTQIPSLEDLLKFPEESLGGAYGRFLKHKGFEIDFYSHKNSFGKELDYLILQAKKAHDLMHLISGYETDVIGELALQAFIVGQMKSSPLSMVLLSGGFLHLTLNNYQNHFDLLSILMEALTRGKDSKFMITFEWDSYWETPLIEVRNILRVPDLNEGYPNFFPTLLNGKVTA